MDFYSRAFLLLNDIFYLVTLIAETNMIENQENWIREQLEILEKKSAGLIEPHLKNNGVDFIKNAIQLMPEKINNSIDWQEFQLVTSKLISEFPTGKENDNESKKKYQQNLSAYKQLLMKKYKVVPQGYYMLVWMPLGIGIGLPFGLIFKNIALGIPIGIGLGLAIGAYFDLKAKNENRQI